MQIIVKQSYNHYNSSLGMQIKNKDHYDRVCKERGYVSYEKCQELADKGRLAKQKPYKISKESEQIIREAKLKSDKKGNVKLSDRQIDVLVKSKAIGKKIPDYMKLPSAYQSKGGFA